MDTNYDQYTFWWNFALTICTVLVAVYAWIKARHTATQASINAVGKHVQTNIDKVDERVVRLEERTQHSPSKNEMAALHKRISDQSEVMRRMEGQIQQMNHTLHLINEHLINKGN